ncbi:MAG: DUF262 domain-containing HNH endonuclease family protein [Lachnospiraceae bacterium]|nr:DUF262 domain-containing HNH endonuclease family protein [Lachnospiraceae bacterium]
MKITSGRMLNDYIQPNKNQYCIPVFQRDYAWTSEQCEKLFEDIIYAYRKDADHFCGSFVYAPLSAKNHINYYIIIDGQQRFTTLYILIKALADSAKDLHDKEALEGLLFNEDRFNRYGFDEKSKLKLKPVKTDNDQLQLLMTDNIDKMDKSKNGIIYHNYMLFKDQIESFLNENPDHTVMMIHDGIDHLICADIRLDENDDAQEIFERINSTGMVLGLPDLIRNFVLMTDEEQDRLYDEYWLPTQELLNKDRLESFFLDFLNLKLDGFTKESSAYTDFKQVYNDGLYTNETMLKEILHYAKQYHVFFAGDKNLNEDINIALSGLKRLNQTTVYLFLFNIFDDYEAGIIDQSVLGKVLNFLLSYSIRRLICEIGSNSLRGLYKTLYSRVFIRPENKDHYYDAIVSFMLQLTSKDAIPTDADFIAALKERNLYRKNALCKYLLGTIENQGKERVITDNLTIEHIMPQNKNLSKSWQNMLGEDWINVREKYLHTLGNLTLTGYNSELGDKPFKEKKELLDDTVTHVVVLYSDVKDKEEWNADTIGKRAVRLSEEIVKTFPIEQPEVKIEFTDPRYVLYTAEDSGNATYKYVNFYELLGERVNVDSFAIMVRSVAEKLYELDERIIDQMASGQETFPSWNNPVFSYDPAAIRNPIQLKKDSGIYISSGYSAYDCISFIRELLKKYDLDIEDDFVYSARPSSGKENGLDRIEIEKVWCEQKRTDGKIEFDRKNSGGKLVRFTTPYLNSIIPESSGKLSPWKTSNFYFYEIANKKGEIYVQLYFYCRNLSDEMKDAFGHLADILNLGELEKGYKLYFKSSTFEKSDSDTTDRLSKALDTMLDEVNQFESEIKQKW